jgi:hypothetical protein
MRQGNKQNMKWLRLTERIIASKWETKINEINEMKKMKNDRETDKERNWNI